LDPGDVRSLSLGKLELGTVKEQGSHDLDIRLWGTMSLPKRPSASVLKGLEPIYYSILPSYISSTVVFLSLKQSKIFTLAEL
jgi:hypothetical protein